MFKKLRKLSLLQILTLIIVFSVLIAPLETGKGYAAEKVIVNQLVKATVVVKDLQKSMERYWDLFGIGPWEVYTLQPPSLTNTTVRGKSEPYTVKLASTRVGMFGLELVQPLTGPSIYKEFLEKKGEGLQNVAVATTYDYDSTMDVFGKQGIKTLMSHTWAGTTYAYLDMEKDLKCVLEIQKMRPRGMPGPTPETVYPSPGAKVEKPEKALSIPQLCVVVNDIEEAMKRYWDILGMGPWRIHTYTRQTGLTNMNIHGKPEPYGFKIAMAYVGTINWELIQPLEGPSIYREFLNQKGEGLHHVFVVFGNYQQAVESLEKKGIRPMMTGTMAQGTFGYLDTEKELGTILEAFTGRPAGIRVAVDGYYPK